MQERQHKQEDDFLEFLRNNYWQVWETYSDLHNDFSTGVDVKLDGVEYDLKVSNSKRISIFKKHKGDWYSPLAIHQEVKYLYVTEHAHCYILYEIRKESIIKYLLNNPQITEYTGDGNDNICCSLDLDAIADDIFCLRKHVRRTK